jgi:hypothetical protein
LTIHEGSLLSREEAMMKSQGTRRLTWADPPP